MLAMENSIPGDQHEFCAVSLGTPNQGVPVPASPAESRCVYRFPHRYHRLRTI